MLLLQFPLTVEISSISGSRLYSGLFLSSDYNLAKLWCKSCSGVWMTINTRAKNMNESVSVRGWTDWWVKKAPVHKKKDDIRASVEKRYKHIRITSLFFFLLILSVFVVKRVRSGYLKNTRRQKDDQHTDLIFNHSRKSNFCLDESWSYSYSLVVFEEAESVHMLTEQQVFFLEKIRKVTDESEWPM